MPDITERQVEPFNGSLNLGRHAHLRALGLVTRQDWLFIQPCQPVCEDTANSMANDANSLTTARRQITPMTPNDSNDGQNISTTEDIVQTSINTGVLALAIGTAFLVAATFVELNPADEFELADARPNPPSALLDGQQFDALIEQAVEDLDIPRSALLDGQQFDALVDQTIEDLGMTRCGA